MKRSRHRWLGLTLFCCTLMLLSLELPSTSALKATSLLRKTTTTTVAPQEEEVIEDVQLETTGEGGEGNTTNSKLTGIPQIDYVYDPNLPRELNGYNLSEYPFLDTVPKPELIDFKCEGLHDGFYASIPLKCQVYHHCLYGFRYDFLCANYTAFDQKTFICQFVSEVDCINSPKHWSRNDALYKATTAKPTPTTPTTTTTTTTTRPPRPLRRRRPYYDEYYDDEEYYTARDDYEYDERPRRPRPRPGSRQGGKKRPVDDYEDERYDRRRPGTARGRPNKRPYDRRPYEEDEDRRPYRSGSRRPRPRDEIDDKYDDERLTRDSDRETARDDRDERPRRPIDDDVRPKRPIDDDRDVRPKRPIDDDRDVRPKRPVDDDRDVRPKRPANDERPRRPIDEEVRPKRPIDDVPRDELRPKKPVDDQEDLVPIRPINYNKPRKEFRPWNEKAVEPVDEDDYDPKLRERDEIRPRDEKRARDDRLKDERPTARDEYRPRDDQPEPRTHNFKSRDERKPFREDTSRGEDRYQSKGRRNDESRPTRENRPRDDRPRPFRERNYEDERPEKKELTTATAGLVKPVGTGIFAQPRMPPKIKRPVPLNAKDKFEYVPVQTTKAPTLYDDEYDDYDEEDTRRPSSSGKSSSVQQRVLETVEKEKFKPSRSHLGNKSNRRPIDYDEEYYDETTSKNYKKEIRNRPKTDDYYYDEDDNQDRGKQKDIETKVKNIRTNVKVVKRPFLPSRGGSPYLPRGLQPVAGRDMTDPINTTPRITTTTTTTSEPITNPPTTPAPTTKPTTRPTTRTTTTTTTPKPTTTTVTTQQTTTELKPEEEYEYYEEEDYDKKESTTAFVETTTKTETTTYLTTLPPETTTTTRTTTPRPTTPRSTTPNPTTAEPTTTDEKVKNLETQVLRVYNQNYEAIRDKLASTLTPGEYVNPYLATPKPPQDFRPKVQINPEISKPYTATGKPFIPENISIKQNLADSIENEFDVRINEALAPKYSPRIPTGFSVPDRDYTFARYRNIQPEPQFAASEISNFQVRKRQQPLVSIRTPNSYYIQPQRMFEDPNRYPRHLLYRPEFF